MVHLRWKFACVHINEVQMKQKIWRDSMVGSACVVSYFDIWFRKMSFGSSLMYAILTNGRCRKNMRIFSYLTSCSRFCYHDSLALFHLFTNHHSFARSYFTTNSMNRMSICYWRLFSFTHLFSVAHFSSFHRSSSYAVLWLNDKCARYTSQHFMASFFSPYLMLIAWKMLQF